MIFINKAGIDDVAFFWAENVKSHLNENLSGRNRVRYKYGERIRFFSTRLEKYRFVYLEKVSRISDLSQSERKEIWRRIEKLLNDVEFIKGTKAICEKWVRWQNIFLKNEDLKTVIKDIFIGIYEDISSNIAYIIFEKLSIRTCPYCNRHYTFTISSPKRQFQTRPEFDHFYDKSTYPLLAVSFYNLVPSCKECNHGKRNNACGVNPYFDGFKSKFIIRKPDVGRSDGNMNINEILKLSRESEFTLDFKMPNDINTKKSEKINIETLGLLPLYNMHKDYVMEIVEKAAAYDELTRIDIVDKFQGIFHSEVDVFNLIFGKYLSDSNHANRPLSKLTADILDQLEIRPDFPKS